MHIVSNMGKDEFQVQIITCINASKALPNASSDILFSSAHAPHMLVWLMFYQILFKRTSYNIGRLLAKPKQLFDTM